MNADDKIFGLIAQAEDIQAQTVKLHQTTQADIKTHLDAVRGEIRSATREIIEQGAKDATRGLLDAAKEAKAAAGEGKTSAALLRRTGLFQGAFLLLVALVAIGAVYFAGSLLFKSRLEELAELRTQLVQARSTLDELQSKTWGLELMNYSDGGRGIILPKGTTFSHKAKIENGRTAIIIKP